MTEPLPPALAGERLDRAVALLTQTSRSGAAALVAAGAVQVNGRVRTDRAARLSEGDELVVAAAALADQRSRGKPRAEPDVEVAVVHEDPHLVVVEKPAGLVVHPGAGRTAGTLCGALLARYPEMAAVGEATRPGIVHRLDAGTSGLLVAARSTLAYDSLVAQLAARTVRRRYEAICWGTVGDDRGLIDAPVGRSGRRPAQMAVTERGRPARTGYEVRHRYSSPAPVTHLRCRLETGRTHQIRVHLAAIGHPLLGEEVYGSAPAELSQTAKAALRLDRPALHAALLGFDHPTGGREMLFESTLPADLGAVLAAVA
ncbi:MAG: RluA family pseudouridine synthase [Acidimicrobiia bacterium]|nr:RluA family pseudouridine synthase [Acidimicrobiia bacterium]